jgi:hypothetical protein
MESHIDPTPVLPLDGTRAIGIIDMVIRDEHGVRERRVTKNLITSAGKAALASRINGAGGEAAFTYLAVGNISTNPLPGDTGLLGEISTAGLARALGTASRATTTVNNDTAQVNYVFTVSGTAVIKEAGLFNASSGGSMAGRQSFADVSVQSGDSFSLTYKIQQT